MRNQVRVNTFFLSTFFLVLLALSICLHVSSFQHIPIPVSLAFCIFSWLWGLLFSWVLLESLASTSPSLSTSLSWVLQFFHQVSCFLFLDWLLPRTHLDNSIGGHLVAFNLGSRAEEAAIYHHGGVLQWAGYKIKKPWRGVVKGNNTLCSISLAI